MSVLIWVQTVCKGYHQMTKVAFSKEEFNTVQSYLPQWLMLENIYRARAGSKTVSSQSLHQPFFLLPPHCDPPIYFYPYMYVSVKFKT